MKETYSYTALHRQMAACFAKDDAVGLQQTLMNYRSIMVRLMEELVHPETVHNPLDRKQVESGSVIFPSDATARKITPEFARAALALSQHLHINELEAAEWLQAAIEQRTRWSSVTESEIDAAIHLYYSERRHLLQAIYDVLLGSRDPSIAVSVRDVCSAFMMEILSESLEENQMRYSTRILKILERLDKELYETF
jgi:hypothetical protein